MASLGISGTDERKRIRQAQIGIAGEIKGKNGYAARFGISALNNTARKANIGIAGMDRPGKVAVVGASATGAMGVSGNINDSYRKGLVNVNSFKRHDEALSDISLKSNRLGDRAARQSWSKGVWFTDFTYVMNSKGQWRKGREQVFARPYRELPLYIDSCGYRRLITGTAPNWAKAFEVYPAAIELLDPDGYAAWDNPDNRSETLKYLYELMQLYPNDQRLWPVFSIRWTWNDTARLSQTPGWAGSNLAPLIPLTRTQRPVKEETRAGWARLAIANAILLAQDPDFRRMIKISDKVMLGGMIKSGCPRVARHLFAATLCHIFPDTQFWLLGQANFSCVNGLGKLGLLDRVWVDGTWWILDATAERFAVVEDGLITMESFESNYRKQTFFTLIEMMAANLRSLLAAYEGLWTWPPPEPLPLDFMDINQVVELKTRYQMAQMELGL